MNAVEQEAVRICYRLRNHRWLKASEVYDLPAEVRSQVDKNLAACGLVLYLNLAEDIAVVDNDPAWASDDDEQMPTGSIYDRSVKIVLVALYAYLVMPYLRSGNAQVGKREIHDDTVYKLLPGISKSEIDMALRALYKAGYLKGHYWPRTAGPRLLAIPEKLAEMLESETYFALIEQGMDQLDKHEHEVDDENIGDAV